MDQLASNYKMLVRNAWRLFYLSHGAWAASMAEAGLTSSSFSVLEMIVQNPGVTQQEITEQISLDKSCTSRACKTLEAAGFIRREKSLQSAHAFHCYPTEKAAGVVEDIVEKESRHIHRLFEGEDPACMEKAVKLLSHLIEQLQKES